MIEEWIRLRSTVTDRGGGWGWHHTRSVEKLSIGSPRIMNECIWCLMGGFEENWHSVCVRVLWKFQYCALLWTATGATGKVCFCLQWNLCSALGCAVFQHTSISILLPLGWWAGAALPHWHSCPHRKAKARSGANVIICSLQCLLMHSW